VAFIEGYGVDWIEKIVSDHGIAKSNVEVFLYSQFSIKKPQHTIKKIKEHM
jgi:hypothetical protein